jgi:CheY-like chemotaxis protein
MATDGIQICRDIRTEGHRITEELQALLTAEDRQALTEYCKAKGAGKIRAHFAQNRRALIGFVTAPAAAREEVLADYSERSRRLVILEGLWVVQIVQAAASAAKSLLDGRYETAAVDSPAAKFADAYMAGHYMMHFEPTWPFSDTPDPFPPPMESGVFERWDSPFS